MFLSSIKMQIMDKRWNSIELFAGCGGLALGFELAGIDAVMLIELNKDACATLRANRPTWNVQQCSIADVDFSPYKGTVDVISGGFPCQSFSYAGRKRGLEDVRGTLFFEFARAIKEAQPKVFVGENVKGLLKNDGGKTLETMAHIIDEIGYKLVDPTILKAVNYRVPQKRERLFLVGIRKDLLPASFNWPSPCQHIMTMRDALIAGDLYPVDVPRSSGAVYALRKAEIMGMVSPGGCWRDLPDVVQREYMKGSYFLSGGKTGMARRLSWDEPCLTLTCSPAQNQTERCHPSETRPLTVREYARIQTFPDSWEFAGSMSSQYKQIGNAVPVNLAYAVGQSVVALLEDIDSSSSFSSLSSLPLFALAG
jgi:DNA (cytosine-5)-methyltransferase 1